MTNRADAIRCSFGVVNCGICLMVGNPLSENVVYKDEKGRTFTQIKHQVWLVDKEGRIIKRGRNLTFDRKNLTAIGMVRERSKNTNREYISE